MTLYMVRYSEIGLKGERERKRMENILMSNITRYYEIGGMRSNCRLMSGHILVDAEDDGPLRHIMGIKSYSPVNRFRFETLEDIRKIASDLYGEKVGGKTFGVRCNRTGTHSFTSLDVERSIGDALYDKSAGVNLRNPDIWIHADILGKDVFFYHDVIPGPGGLPLGSEGKYIALVSGGIDSPVATWMVMKRGSPCDILFCSLSYPVDLKAFVDVVKKLVERWAPYKKPRIFIADCRSLIRTMVVEGKTRYSNVTFKRVIYRLAEKLALENGYNGIVTGESLGQVSSQTAENLRSIENGISVPVIRPLIGMDKDEVVDIARRIGTFPEVNMGEFCSLFASHPIIRSRPEDIDEDMKAIDMEDLFSSIRSYDIDGLTGMVGSDLSLKGSLPKDAVVIDLRPRSAYDKEHVPDSINMTIREAMDISDKDRTYVIYCSMGLQSAYVASVLRNHGIKAYYSTFRDIKKMVSENESGKLGGIDQPAK
ncbi:THUMP domain-containing protein [Thermoplasma sp.]|uniref:tRNA sulfurtransferase n=1 Tax=Thermoplasma sp. TaxID=1973142 RepID=UPI0012857DFF|nr:THUMP domain-containing protein [Thermoplasma sp.]KAA8923413.1 MAG: tRNA 4-thiouridine(8) synthase ThiI [Thermoplasma sp.]